jgi:YidC/Oxa1 family membrane protein insertase
LIDQFETPLHRPNSIHSHLSNHKGFMDTQRLIALVVFTFSGMMLWEAWNKHNHPQPPVAQTQAQSPQVGASSGADKSAVSAVPNPSVPLAVDRQAIVSPTPAASAEPVSDKRVSVTTDTLAVELDTRGGDIREVTLLKHPAHGDVKQPFKVMQDKAGAYFIAQSGLLGTGLPNHTAVWTAAATKYSLTATDMLEVPFTNNDLPGVLVTKTVVFTRGSYVIDVRYDVKNESAVALAPTAYFQFLRDGNPPEGESSGNMFTGVATFTGPAIYSDAKKFQKVNFTDIDKNKQEHVKEGTDGWIAMVQHYFVSAWLPADKSKREFFTKKVSDKIYSLGVITPMAPIAAGSSGQLSMPLYVGPQEQEKLKELAPGLDLVVDYGWLTVLAYPMFLVLSWINKIVANWGWTIIIFTILLKLVFFPLNQKAGKSMAHMKQLAPKVEALKARYGDDKVKMNQAMMELYRTEKVNPLGGCLPILIQMPFLIAMYWVLLGAVELRNAPWLGWITDLSTPDPFYVLPVIMGASMFIQTKLNPAPPDPVQAKVMLIMPLVFSVMFFFFPAGLVLYWTMQNILGIGQQWYINKTTAEISKSKAHGTKT